MTQLHADNRETEPAEAAMPALAARLAPWPVRSERCVRAVALGVALMAHAAILYVLVREPDDLMAGAGGQQLDAISVTIVNAGALEAREAAPAKLEAPASSETVDMTDGAPDSAPAVAREEKDEKRAEEQKDKKPLEEPIVKTEAMFEAAPQPKQDASKPQSPAAALGGVAARGDDATPSNASAAAAASPGVVREFARYVSLALSRTKPKGSGGQGSVRVKFVIAPSGGLASAAVAKSSGNQALDQKALDAVRLASFPLPPAGMSLAQLTYEVPYHFR